MIVLDTNVVFEQTRPRPSETVLRWASHQRRTEMFTTAITEAEVLLGVELLPRGRKKEALSDQIRKIFEADFAGRVLSFDGSAAQEFAIIVSERLRMGRPINEADAQIAAIARSHGAIIATRNRKDFEHCGIEVVDPWTA